MEPGNDSAQAVRLTISMQPEDEADLLELKHKLEADSKKRISMSELFRQGIRCLREREGLE